MKKTCIIFTTITLILIFFTNARAQEYSANTLYTQQGVTKPYTAKHYLNLEGDPFLYSNWEPAEVTLTDGKTYKDLLLKYNEVTGDVIFKYAPADSAMAFALPVTEFKFTNKPYSVRFISGLLPADGGNAATFYQLLSNGRVKLVKRNIKIITETKAYNAGEISQQVNVSTSYYIVIKNQPFKVRSKKSILTVLDDRAEQIKAYIYNGRIDFKNESDYTRIVNYYNSL